jgi:hypothetical protein
MRIRLLAFIYFAVADFPFGAPVEEDWHAIWADEFEETGEEANENSVYLGQPPHQGTCIQEFNRIEVRARIP